MQIKNEYSIQTMFILCLLGSLIASFIVKSMFNLNLIIFSIIFICFSAFLIKITNTGSVRKLELNENNLAIYTNTCTNFEYTDVESILLVIDVPRRITEHKFTRNIDLIIHMKNGDMYALPYENFKKSYFILVEFLLSKNKNISVSKIFELNMNEQTFNQILLDIKKCKITDLDIYR